MKRTNIHLTEEQLKKFDELAKKTGLKRSELIRRALDEYLERHGKKKGE